MAEKESLRHINNTPWEHTLKKIGQNVRAYNEQVQEQNKMRQEKQAIEQLTNVFLDFAQRFFSLPKETLAMIEPEECQILCESLLLHARLKLKRRLPLRICGTVAIWASWVAAVILPFVVTEDQMAARIISLLLSGMFGGMIAFALTTDVWDGMATSFLRTHNKCLSLTDKPGALMVEHAREAAQKETPPRLTL